MKILKDLKIVHNKRNGQFNISIPKKKLPKGFLKNLDLKKVKVKLEFK